MTFFFTSETKICTKRTKQPSVEGQTLVPCANTWPACCQKLNPPIMQLLTFSCALRFAKNGDWPRKRIDITLTKFNLFDSGNTMHVIGTCQIKGRVPRTDLHAPDSRVHIATSPTYWESWFVMVYMWAMIAWLRTQCHWRNHAALCCLRNQSRKSIASKMRVWL